VAGRQQVDQVGAGVGFFVGGVVGVFVDLGVVQDVTGLVDPPLHHPAPRGAVTKGEDAAHAGPGFGVEFVEIGSLDRARLEAFCVSQSKRPFALP